MGFPIPSTLQAMGRGVRANFSVDELLHQEKAAARDFYHDTFLLSFASRERKYHLHHRS